MQDREFDVAGSRVAVQLREDVCADFGGIAEGRDRRDRTGAEGQEDFLALTTDDDCIIARQLCADGDLVLDSAFELYIA